MTTPARIGGKSGQAARRPLKVALYAGVVFEHDAVSRSLLHKLDLLERLRDEGLPVEAVVFTQASDYDRPAIHVVPGIFSLLREPEFTTADVHVFEFAMWYELFNALFLINGPSVVVDHNTTPPGLVGPPEIKLGCQRACVARQNLERASRILAVGEFTRDELIAIGMPPERLSVLHLPAANPFLSPGGGLFRPRSDHEAPEVVRLLYVGRLVPAKGLGELLGAMTTLWSSGEERVELVLAGSMRFCDPVMVDAIESAVDAYGPRGLLRLVTDAGDHEIAELFATSDILVLPSQHEGYCVPVVEALTAGCYVIGSDAGNLPNVMGGLGTSFPAGDGEALRRAIEQVVAAIRGQSASGEPANQVRLPTDGGLLSLDEYRSAVARHLEDYTLERFEAGFLRVLDDVVETWTASGRQIPLLDRAAPSSRPATVLQ